MDKETKEFEAHFEYCRCDYCDDGTAWECRTCRKHFCPDCTEKHTKKKCKDGD